MKKKLGKQIIDSVGIRRKKGAKELVGGAAFYVFIYIYLHCI